MNAFTNLMRHRPIWSSMYLKRNCFFKLGTKKVKKAQIINGKTIAESILFGVEREIERWILLGNRNPHLNVILIGNNPASNVYVKNKIKAANRTGITSETIRLPESTSQKELLSIISNMNSDINVDGILVQLPLPSHMDEHAVCNAVHPGKDVDGFHTVNLGRLCSDMRGFLPCTAAGVLEILKRTNIETKGKHVVVCGRSSHVGLPISLLLGSENLYGNATVSVCHRKTHPDDLASLVKMADILVSATGVPNLITANMVKEGVCVIDVGITFMPDPLTGKSKYVGDVEFEGVCEKASYITPVPGGVGPVTVAMLMKNTFLAAKQEIRY